MRCVEVRAGRPYEVFIGRGLMDAAGGMIVEALGGTRMAAILTDDTVDALYGARVEQALSESGLRTCRFACPTARPTRRWQRGKRCSPSSRSRA